MATLKRESADRCHVCLTFLSGCYVMANADDEMGGSAMLPNCEEDEQNNQGEDDADEEITPGEYQMLDAKLDDLNIALDLIEKKNDKIREEFLKLLHSNQQIREELKQEKHGENGSNSKDEPAKDNNSS